MDDTTPRDGSALVRIGIVGSGALAAIRGDAVSASEGGQVVAVASRRHERAAALAARYPGAAAHTVDELLARDDLDAVLVALPHRVQDEVVLRALGRDLSVLIGGPLASTVETGRRIVAEQRRSGAVVEVGYEARYSSLWRRAAEIVGSGELGELVSVRSNAGFDQVLGSWYYEQEASGGMLITHLSYAFLNPLRWLLGEPVFDAAIGNAKRQTDAASVWPETCLALARFPGDLVGAFAASYVKPEGLDDWTVTIVGTEGAIEMQPADLEPGWLRLVRPGTASERTVYEPDGFGRQIAAFVAAVRTGSATLNPPADALRDLELSARIQEQVGPRPS